MTIRNQSLKWRQSMKKNFLMLICLVAGTTLVHAQSYMAIDGVEADVTTNTSSFYNQGMGATGKTMKTMSGSLLYDYALFVSAIPIAGGVTASGWTQIGTFTGTPVIAGGDELIGGAVIYSGGEEFQSDIAVGSYYVEIAGWSSDLGSTWAAVDTQLTGNNGSGAWMASGYFGEAYSGTADFETAVAAPGDNIIGPYGIAFGSLVLYAVPEPATLALAGLGGLSMLFLRRRKS